MIDALDYSNKTVTYVINLGALTVPGGKKHVSKIMEKCKKDIREPIQNYGFISLSGTGTWVLVVTSYLQYIPELVKILSDKMLGVYELKPLGEFMAEAAV